MDSNDKLSEQPKNGAESGGDPWRGRFEIIATVILGLASVISAWGAFRAGMWDGSHVDRLAEASAYGRTAAEKRSYATQVRMVDAFLLEEYMRAHTEKNKPLEGFIFRRLSPEMKAATEAWLATEPLTNAESPRSPFQMSEYSVPAEREAKELQEKEAAALTAAGEAGSISDRFLLVTVIASLCLFLAGVTAALEKQKLRSLVLGGAILTLIVAVVLLFPLPLGSY